MRKTLFAIVASLFVAGTINAQTVEESNTTDNWYVGINAGVNAKTTHTSTFEHLNVSAGLRVGRYFTPVFGFAAEGELYFGNKGSQYDLKTFVKGVNVSLLGTTNFSNWFAGYPGEPRTFEIIGLYGIGWGHAFDSPEGISYGMNDAFTTKFAIDFALNLGKSKALQVYLEPVLNYALNNGGDGCTNGNSGVQFNLNNSSFGVLVGLNYKFGNSNGTHNFKIAELRDQAEIDALNAQINALRADNAAKDGEIARKNGELGAKDREIGKLRKDLDDCLNRPTDTVVVDNKAVLQPTVVFGQGKSNVESSQVSNVAMVAKYMKNHPESNILIKGYASPEGDAQLNQTLSEKRAESVKAMLVNRYKISESRLSTKGLGATDELFDELEFNRVCTFTDTTK